MVESLIADIGLRPIYIGDLAQAVVIDNLTSSGLPWLLGRDMAAVWHSRC